MLCIRINNINPLYVIIILTLKILFSVGSQHFFCVWIILDTIFLVQDDKMITAM